MKKVIPALVVLLVVGACLPTVPTPISPTATAVIGSSNTPTLAPSNTAPPSETPVVFNPSVTAVSASSTPESTATSSPLPNLTSTLATSTDAPATLAQSTATGAQSTATVAQLTSTPTLGGPSLTPTLGILKYGTLPPEVPFNRITLVNRSKRQAYISLQVTMPDGRYSIIEYPVYGQVKIKAPLGYYVYVAWVGGNKMTGTFRLTSTDGLAIYLFKDKVVIK